MFDAGCQALIHISYLLFLNGMLKNLFFMSSKFTTEFSLQVNTNASL